MLVAGGVLGGAVRLLVKSNGLPGDDWRGCRGVTGEEGECSETYAAAEWEKVKPRCSRVFLTVWMLL